MLGKGRRFLTRARPRYSVLLVCTANLCRSPMAEAMLRDQLAQRGLDRDVRVASAGIRALVGRPPDPRTLAVLKARNLKPGGQRARQLRSADYEAYDLILGMMESHRSHLRKRSPEGCEEKIGTVTDFVPDLQGSDIPDPYYGNQAGFERVAELLDAVTAALADEVAERLAAASVPE